MNEIRSKALEAYSSLRSRHLECHRLSAKPADMVVRVDYFAPNRKDFTIVSESGSGNARNRVFRKLPESNKGETKVHIFGTAALTITYEQYEMPQQERLKRGVSFASL